MKYFACEKDDAVALIRFNDPDERMNVLKPELLKELSDLLDQMEADKQVRALILISGKADCFIAGADIQMFKSMPESEESMARAREGHALLNRLATFPVPTIAAIAGVCLGGGLEIALACQYRIAADYPKTVFGVPEVKLGLLPGLGGTQRLPRLVGLQAALDMLLTGKNVYAGKAKKMGLVDELVHRHGLETAAQVFALKKAEKPGRRKRKRGFAETLLASSLGRSLVFSAARKKVMKMTAGNYPAPLKILEVVKTGLSRGLDQGYQAEVIGFDELVRGEASKSLVNLFFGMTASKKNPRADLVRPVKNVGILGAGLMGSGIAEVTLPGDYRVWLKDISPEALGRGEKAVWDVLSKKVKRKIWSTFQRDQAFSQLHGVTDYASLGSCELVIEAVFEDLDLKHKVLAEVEANTPEHCIFASNTSSIPIAFIASKAKRPEQVIGMHYFSPVGKMPLLEIVVTDKTADWVIATAVAVGVKQGKHVIVVKDGPGFYTTRVLGPMMQEAVILLNEGVAIEDVDRAMFEFGFPVGPITLIDEVGIDVGAHVGETFEGMMTERQDLQENYLKPLVEAGYLGRKNKKGFYRYDSKGKKPVNTDIYTFFGGPNRKKMPFSEIQERLSLLFVNEAAWCLSEGIIANPADGDLGAILGLGFPPFRGGPFRYMDRLGAKTVVAKMEALEKRLGARFRPAPIIREHLDKPFHGD